MAFERLKNLGDDKWQSIKVALVGSVPPQELAVKIQQDWGGFSDVSESILTKELKRLKLYLDAETQEEVQDAIDPLINEDQEDTSIDSVKELENLIQLQKQRIAFMVKKEQSMGMPIPNLDKLIRECTDTIKELERVRKEADQAIWEDIFTLNV